MHPENEVDSVDWLLKTEAAFYDAMKEAAEECRVLQQEKLAASNWIGPKPWYRLYLCSVQDEAIEALKVRSDCLDKDELDAGQNHSDRPKTFEEIVADLYNDVSFVAITEALPDLHTDFAEPIALTFRDMPGGKITAETVKSRMSDARAKVLQVSHSGDTV